MYSDGTHRVQIKEAQDMEKSLINAIARAKRNAFEEKYSFLETLLDVIYEYDLRDDEIEPLYNSIIKYCDKNNLYLGLRCDLETVMDYK